MATYKQINTLTNNKRTLLEYAGYKSIKAYRKDFPYFRNDESAYKFLLGEYNDIIDMLNEQERQKKEAEKNRKKDEDKRKKAQTRMRQKAIETKKKAYLTKLKNQIITAERTNKKTTIPLNMDDLNNDFDAFLSVLNPRMRKYVLTSGGRVFMLNSNTIDRLRGLFNNPLEAEFLEWESGNEVLQSITQNEPFVLTIYPIGYKGHFDKVDGGFFPYTHNLGIDLTRYSVFKTGTAYGDNINDENCLITAFKSAGYDTTMVKTFVKNQYVPMRYLKDIADKMNIYITLKKIGTYKDTHSYGNKSNPHLRLGLLEKHYFLI